jgi:ferritin-like metal-binding protein YciE
MAVLAGVEVLHLEAACYLSLTTRAPSAGMALSR